MSQENIPWNKLTEWEAKWIAHTLESQRMFGRPLPANSFSIIVCKNILRKAKTR